MNVHPCISVYVQIWRCADPSSKKILLSIEFTISELILNQDKFKILIREIRRIGSNLIIAIYTDQLVANLSKKILLCILCEENGFKYTKRELQMV
jgi:hypothetical protein